MTSERAPQAAGTHPTVTVVEEAARTYGPSVYGCLGINQATDLRYEMHVLFMKFVDERSKGRLPDFGHQHYAQLKAEFLEELRKDIAGLTKQVLESVPSDAERDARRSSKERQPGLPRRAQRPRMWR